MKTRVTLNDVAVHANVSPATASLVLRGTGRVSERTRARVRASMEALGYVYHRGAASLRANHSSTVGLIVSDITNVFTAELAVGLESALATEGMITLVTSSLEDPDRQTLLVRSMLERQVDGLLIILVVDTDPAFVARLAELPIPVVIASREPNDSDLTFVGIDNLRGGRLAAEHLGSHHVRHAGFLGGFTQLGPRNDRLAGAAAVLAQQNIPITVDVPGPPTGAWGLTQARELLARGDLPDGLICLNDEVAFGVYRALREAEIGASGIHVVSFDDVAEAVLWEPPLTTVAASGREVGQRCAEVLQRRVGHPHAPAERSLILPTITVRESCGCSTAQPPANQPAGTDSSSSITARKLSTSSSVVSNEHTQRTSLATGSQS